MADPRTVAGSVESRKTGLSPLLQAKSRAIFGEKVNFCPFGCEDESIDEHGYCRHLVGFTTDKKVYEPMVFDERTQTRVIRVRKDENNKPILDPIQRGDKLVLISISSRVYRDTGVTVPELPDLATKPKGATRGS